MNKRMGSKVVEWMQINMMDKNKNKSYTMNEKLTN
jgi:hypothetical protein